MAPAPAPAPAPAGYKVAMELDFSTDGSPEASFESAAPGSAADGSVEVVVCGVPLRIFQGEGLGGRLWFGGLALAGDIERGVVLRHHEGGAAARI